MRFRALLVLILGVLVTFCDNSKGDARPAFPDGGLLRLARPLPRSTLLGFEAMYVLSEGRELFEDQVAVISSPSTVSILSGKDAGYAVLGAGCLNDGRLVLEGYWSYPRVYDTGLVRLFVSKEHATAMCNGTPIPATPIKITGGYSKGNDFPDIPLVLTRDRNLQPWRGKFYSVAHHGACEPTDNCGVSPNTLETIRLAMQVGANAMEPDVRITKDGVPILFHDPSFSGAGVRGAFCHGTPAALTYAEIRANCQLEHGEHIPTLEEALHVMLDDTELEWAYLDMKVPEVVEPATKLAREINDLAKARGVPFRAVIALTKETVTDAWKALNVPHLDPPCLMEYDPDLAISLGCVAWGPTWTAGPRVDDVKKVHDAGIRVIYWTVNEEAFIDDFLTQSQPDGFITARPALVFFRYQMIGTPPP